MPPVNKVLIIGGGVIGLSLARQLRLRSIAVTVSDPAFALQRHLPGPGASYAAAGMLAVEDPGNPPQLLPLSRLSRSLYDDFLADIEYLSGQPVPFQTHRTLQTLPDGRIRELSEESLDPRQLAPALRSAAERLGVVLTPKPLSLKDGAFDAVVYTAGAWTLQKPETTLGTKSPGSHSEDLNNLIRLPVTPRKGQMLRVAIPPSLNLRQVHRAEHVYIVPRLSGPQAGTALIGATVEDVGFDSTISPRLLETLRAAAAALVPALADERLTPTIETWVGFRPATPDALPLLGELARASQNSEIAALVSHTSHPDHRRLVATGHFRNGILLAPATAVVMADLLEGLPPSVSLDAFYPGRFSA